MSNPSSTSLPPHHRAAHHQTHNNSTTLSSPSQTLPTSPTTTTSTSTSQPQLPPPQQQPPPISVSPAQRTAEARTAFLASLHSASANLDSDLSSRAKNIHSNAKALQRQEVAVEKEVRALRKRNEEMEKVVGGMRGEWGREMEKLGFGKGKGKGGEEDLAGEEFLLLGDVERELGRLEEWVRIVEGGDEEAEVEAEPGREEEEEEEGRYVGSDETGVERDKGKGKEVAREESAAASPVK